MPLISDLTHCLITKHGRTTGKTEGESEISREFELQKVTAA